MAAAKQEKDKPAMTAEDLRRKQAEEKVEYIARRPYGTDIKEKDVTVTINGVNYLVQYDKKVKIPRFVRDVLDRAYKESQKVAEKIEEATKQRQIAEF